MGELYQKMEQDLAIKNLADETRCQYLRCCQKFVRYHMRSPREMGVVEIKDFLGQLVREGAGPETVKMHVAGVKFLYGVTLDRRDVAEKIPWPKVPHKQPDILSLSEVERLLAAGIASVVPTMVSMTAYAGGLRIGEACRLRPEDIDCTRMLIHVRLGKGKKDRFVIAYSDDADRSFQWKPITDSRPCRSPSERSDAGVSFCRLSLNSSQYPSS